MVKSYWALFSRVIFKRDLGETARNNNRIRSGLDLIDNEKSADVGCSILRKAVKKV
jgi:hypothetical protein